jgi:hypothetical protein
MQLVPTLSMLIAAIMGLSAVSTAQVARSDEPRDAMILFSYWPKEGQERAFHDGYREHLDWHRANDDPIMWYAWDVIAGRRTGLFIDGAFDISFSSLDNRVKPAEDAADFAATAAPFANIHDRVLYRLRNDLSSGTPLEERRPGGMVLATYWRIKPTGQKSFEATLRDISAQSQRPFTAYQVIAGGETPQYLILNQIDSWAEMGSRDDQRATGVQNLVGAGGEEVVVAVESEVWRYRRDLTYLP